LEINTEELLLAETGKGHTAFHLAAQNNQVETLKKMWVCAEETQINPQELKKILFLAKDQDGCFVWHRTAFCSSIETLETLWILSKEVEINTDILLLPQTGD
jgi:hypothetical protein